MKYNHIQIETTPAPDNGPDTGHTEISIGIKLTDDFPTRPLIDPNGEVRKAWQERITAAGLVSRVALTAYPSVAQSAREHKCFTVSDSTIGPLTCGCSITAHDVVAPGDDMGSNPCITLTIPTDDTDTWLARIRRWFAQAADDANLSRTWVETVQVQHNTDTTTDVAPSDYPACTICGQPIYLDDGRDQCAACKPITHTARSGYGTAS